ncbi:MAG TPA: NADP-dependent oxidoreductase [Tepidisphaeraceae bacterium]|jgi:NADPH:quinone reductase-like Zn-dependent oxidoreductase
MTQTAIKAVLVQAYGGPEQLKFAEAPAPLVVDGCVLVRVRATSVNPWDFKLASGRFKDAIPMKLPYVPGGEFAGTVADVGAGVVGLKKGDAVYGNCPDGAYAELVCAPGETTAPRPATLSFTQAACVPLAGQTAWQGLFDHGQLRRGETVLIHAASGGVGTYAVQLAHWAGARVLATASATHAQYVRELGADQVIDYKATPFESVAKEVDLVLDLVGGQTQQRSFAILRKGGRLISTVQPPDQDQARAHGVTAAMFSMKPSTAGLVRLGELIDDGSLRVVVSKSYPLAHAARAWTEQMAGHTQGKIALELD